MKKSPQKKEGDRDFPLQGGKKGGGEEAFI